MERSNNHKNSNTHAFLCRSWAKHPILLQIVTFAGQSRRATYREMTPVGAGHWGKSVVLLSLARVYAIDSETFARVESR